jgi:hypothetical protein
MERRTEGVKFSEEGMTSGIIESFLKELTTEARGSAFDIEIVRCWVIGRDEKSLGDDVTAAVVFVRWRAEIAVRSRGANLDVKFVL